MEFIDIPVEQTTAVTDAVLAVMAIAVIVYLYRIGRGDRWKATIWIGIFTLLDITAALGTVAHGLKMSNAMQTTLWHPLNLSLGLLVAYFVVAVVYDISGEAASRKIIPLMTLIGAGFFATTLLWPGSFLLFIIYEAVAMLFALAVYIRVALRGDLAGAWLLVAGVFTTIVAAGIQASKAVAFDFVWSFDHNGAYHLVQMVAVVLLVAGLRRSLVSN